MNIAGTATLGQRLYRPPLVGLLALVVALLAVPVTHSLSLLALNLAGRQNSLFFYLPLGALALVLLIWGIRRNDEISGTLIGFATGMLLWTGWASYAFRFNEISLGLPMPALDATTSWPNHLLFIQGSIGICVVTMLYFVFSRDTRCNAFLWIQRRLGLDFGRPESGIGRNYCRITFIETVYVVWFCYGGSLFMADPRFVGYGTPAHYVLTGLLILWGLYLLWRLMKYTRIMAAIRYAIPTKAILWIPFGEVLPNYGVYEDVWMRPWENPRTMLTVLGVLAALSIGTMFVPQRRKA